jgi:hypothetical protein
LNALRTARALLSLAALAAAAAAISAAPVVQAAPPEWQFVEAWRAIGFATFAALFAVLAARPGTGVGVWVVLIANKAALTVSAATWLATAEGAGTAAAWDGALTVLLVASFLLAAPWRSEPMVAVVAPLQAVAA